MLRLVRIQLFPWTPALILAVCLGGAWISSASAVELRLATFFDEKHPIDRFMLRPWAKEIEKRSGGSLTIKFFPDLDPIGQYEFAASGEYDLSTGLPGYTSELFPRTGILELPGVAETGEDAVDKFWDAFHLIEPEWENVKLLALWTSYRNFLMFSGEPIDSIADLNGRRIRVSSKSKSDMIKPFGMVPIFMPITSVYESLKNGEIDGVLTTPSTVRTYKLNEVIVSYSDTLPVGRLTFFLVMNKDKFDSLNEKQKALIEESTGRELSKKFARFFERSGKGGLSALQRSTAVSNIALSVDEQQRGAAILENVSTNRISELENSGIPANGIAEAMHINATGN